MREEPAQDTRRGVLRFAPINIFQQETPILVIRLCCSGPRQLNVAFSWVRAANPLLRTKPLCQASGLDKMKRGSAGLASRGIGHVFTDQSHGWPGVGLHTSSSILVATTWDSTGIAHANDTEPSNIGKQVSPNQLTFEDTDSIVQIIVLG